MSSHRNSSMTQTNWDLIRDAAGSTPTSQASLEEVARRSWPAIYAFIRASGRSPTPCCPTNSSLFSRSLLSRSLLGSPLVSRSLLGIPYCPSAI